jgi:hypothetical protein
MLSESDLISKFAPRYSNTQLTNYIRDVYIKRLLVHHEAYNVATNRN